MLFKINTKDHLKCSAKYFNSSPFTKGPNKGIMTTNLRVTLLKTLGEGYVF